MSRQRDRDAFAPEFKHELPEYFAARCTAYPEFILVWCPRDDCLANKHGRPFLVHKWTWTRPRRVRSVKTQLPTTIVGRSCPYCMKVGKLPSRLHPAGSTPE